MDDTRKIELCGTVVDERYEIISLLGEGGMGAVYRAHQLKVGRDVAIKVLSAHISGDQDIVARFMAEAKIIASLRHPNTVRLFDFGRLPTGEMYCVLELIEGRSMREVLKGGPLSERRVLQILKQVLAALAEAHEHGVVHRDLKPGNIMLDDIAGEEVAKVIDFGISKVITLPDITDTGLIIGTPSYIPPEVVEGNAAVSPACDLYSLGALAYECLAGRRPFEGADPEEIVLRHVTDSVRPPSEVKGAVPMSSQTEALVLSLMAKRPTDRPASAQAALLMVERILSGKPPPSAGALSGLDPTLPPGVKQSQPEVGRLKNGFVIVSAIIVGLASIAGLVADSQTVMSWFKSEAPVALDTTTSTPETPPKPLEATSSKLVIPNQEQARDAAIKISLPSRVVLKRVDRAKIRQNEGKKPRFRLSVYDQDEALMAPTPKYTFRTIAPNGRRHRGLRFNAAGRHRVQACVGDVCSESVSIKVTSTDF